MDYIIIVAGGKGLRMGGDIPKQFLPVGGKPVLMRTIERFHEYNPKLNIILVLPESQQEYWKQLCEKYKFDIPHTIANGGEQRFHSVRNGLDVIPNDCEGVVGVHDGVRPFASVEVIGRCYETARKYGAVIPVTAVVESLRHISGHNVPRAEYQMVQTPQTFDIQLLKKAYKQEYSSLFTDDASVVEAIGHQVTTVDGNRENIKITTPFDMIMAEALV